MNAKTIWIIVAVIVVLGLGAWWLSSMNATAPVATEETPEVAGADNEFVDDSKDGAAQAVTITYTNEGFSPSTVTIKKGQSVTFVNKGTQEMWIGSDEHPTHTGYDGTNKDSHCASDYTGEKPLDQCGVGASYTFTFTKAGTWGYHNHKEDDDHGTVIVTE